MMWAAIPLYRRHGRTAKPQAPTVRHPALLLLVLMMLAATASGAGQPSCPCLANQPQSLNSDGTIDMTLAGITHKYPGSYGVSSCSAHDTGLQPYCAASPPQFCSQNWCYVNPANCNLTSAASTYFSGSYYSYQTCGEANTWSQWFSASSSGSHAITDLADVMKGYLQTISGSVEENYAEVAGSSSASCSLPGACTCSSCAQDTNSVWGTQSIDGTKSTFWERPGTDNAEALRLDQCLATFIGDQFTKIATKESDPNRLGYEYHGSQENGNYVQWPGTDWCPTDYDPRFRPWYAAAASGPKDVVIVLDTSGSMSGNLAQMARNAGKAVLNTLTDVDYVTIVIFSSQASSYSSALVQATASNVVAMRNWIDSNVGASGSTNFRAAFAKTWSVLAASSASTSNSNCNRVVLFLTDGEPNNWEEADYESVKANSVAHGNAKVLTYALGSGAKKDILKRLACENEGISYAVSTASMLADTMASYYKVLAPMLTTCKVRWIEYTDVIAGTTLIAACLASFKPESHLTSCNGGLDSLSDGKVPELLGVSCIDLNMLVPLNVIQAHSDWSSFEARILLDRKSCPEVKLSHPQMETLRAAVSADAVCSPPEDDLSEEAAAFIIVIVILCCCCGGIGFAGKLFMDQQKKKTTTAPMQVVQQQAVVQQAPMQVVQQQAPQMQQVQMQPQMMQQQMMQPQMAQTQMMQPQMMQPQMMQPQMAQAQVMQQGFVMAPAPFRQGP